MNISYVVENLDGEKKLIPFDQLDTSLEECPECHNMTLSFHIKSVGQCSVCIRQNKPQFKFGNYCRYI